MNDLIRRRPFRTLIVLLGLNLLLLSVQLRSVEGRLLITSWTLTLVSPAASMVQWTISSAKEFVGRYVFLMGKAKENRRLRLENIKLRLELAKREGLEKLFERSIDLALLPSQFDFGALPAAVTRKEAPFEAHRFLINAGTRHGARLDGAVIAPEGVMGRIVATTPISSEVELITNAGAAVGALVGNNRLHCVARGNGSGLLVLDYVPSFENIPVGALVYTSGSDQIYPKDLKIGEVVESRRGENQRHLLVRPHMDPRRLEEVLLVLPVSPTRAEINVPKY